MQHLPFLRAIAAAAALGCAAGSAWSLDLAEAYRLAYERDATVRASRAASEAGREKLPQARAQFMPNISASSSRSRNDLTQINFTQFISNIEDTNIPKAVVELQTAQTAYQAALQSTVRSFSTSLLDFLK